MPSHAPAKDVARWQGPTKLWLDHARVGEHDLEWMAPVQSLVLWNVRLPEQALARLPDLVGVSLRGGTASDLGVVRGCESLMFLDVNQIRGLHDLTELSRLRSLEFLSLYGLPRVQAVPSLRENEKLAVLQLGSLKGLRTLAGVIAAPALRSLQLIRRVPVRTEDVEGLASHPTLEQFDWLAEDVPWRIVEPVVDRLKHLDRPRALDPDEWLDQRLGFQ